jgi:hypothetical protein
MHGGWFMKIQNKSKMIISLCLLIALTLFLISNLPEKSDPVVYKRPAMDSGGLNVNSMTVDQMSDLYCGILLMPKSMLPKLEQISRYGFAEDIKILPATIEWKKGCMVAVADDHATADNADLFDRSPGNDILSAEQNPENFAERDKRKFNPALLYYFLANASKSQINY